ncbi:MAG TPA: hypothetical protein VJ850_06360 [Candidatus Limnocylindrales bacterium]|nr:hypothetical protein [Candidatus Limnocylindrales bacterium]
MDNVIDSVAETAAKAAGKVKEVAEKVAASVTPAPLPNDRPTLMALHRAARHKRDTAPLMSHERAEAAGEIERIEVHIAAIERAMDPPLV